MENTKKPASFIIILLVLSLILITCDRSPVAPEPEVKNYPYVFLNRPDWQISSRPVPITSHNEIKRSKLYWHAPRDMTPVDEIYDREVVSGESVVRTFRLIFMPDDTFQSWAGITSGFIHQIYEETEYIEVIAKGTHGKMHLEFGLIDLDIDGDGLAETEDIDMNGVVSEFEDVGLDGLADPDEPGYDPITNPDPNGDNWFFRGEGKCPLPPDQCEQIDWENDENYFYKYLNGTEGNIRDPNGGYFPDKETIWYYGFNTTNAYFSYEIDLKDSRFYVDSLSKNGWNRYHLPLRDSLAFTTVEDDWHFPSWNAIDYVRIWFEGAPGQTHSDTVEFAEIYFMQDEIIREDSNPPPDDNVSYLRDYEYQERRIFDLGLPGELQVGDLVTSLYVYESISQTAAIDPSKHLADFYVDWFDTTKYADQVINHGNSLRVEMIAPDKFQYYSKPDSNKHYVLFNSNRHPYKHLGCYMEVLRGNDTIRIGNIARDTLSLKLLAPKESMAEPTDATWPLMWRNAYRIPRGVSLDDMKIDIYKGLVGTEENGYNLDYLVNENGTFSYIEILGLDQYNQFGQKLSDGLVDDRIEIFRPDYGLLIFPDRTPFNTTRTLIDANGAETPELVDKVPTLYNYTSQTERVENSQYYFKIEITLPE